MRLFTTALLVLTLPACIALDERLIEREPPPTDTAEPQPGPQRPGGTDTGTPVATDDLELVPDVGPRCATLIASLEGDVPAPEQVVDVYFDGPSTIDVVTFQARADEIVITMTIDEGSLAGLNDLIVELEDDDLIVEDAFRVSGADCD